MRSLIGRASDHLIFHFFTSFKSLKVLDEVVHHALYFIMMSSGRVGRDEAIGCRPERMIRGQGLGRHDVEAGSTQRAARQRSLQRGLIDGIATADVVENGASFHARKSARVEEAGRGIGKWEEIDYVISGGEQVIEGGDRVRFN